MLDWNEFGWTGTEMNWNSEGIMNTLNEWILPGQNKLNKQVGRQVYSKSVCLPHRQKLNPIISCWILLVGLVDEVLPHFLHCGNTYSKGGQKLHPRGSVMFETSGPRHTIKVVLAMVKTDSAFVSAAPLQKSIRNCRVVLIKVE